MIEKFISYLPHGREIIVLKEILELGKNNISCRVLARGSAFNAIEYFAQAAALGRIANAKSKAAKLGMIIRIKEFKVFSDQLYQTEICQTVQCQTVQCQTVQCQTVQCQTVQCQTVQCSWSESIGGVYEVQAQAFDQNNNLVSSATITMMEQE